MPHCCSLHTGRSIKLVANLLFRHGAVLPVFQGDVKTFKVTLRQNLNISKLPSARGTCVTEDGNDTRPGTQTDTGTTSDSENVSGGSSSLLFQPVRNGCLVSPPSQRLGAVGSLTLALWMKPSSPGEM